MVDLCAFVGILCFLLVLGLFKNRKVQSEETFLFAGRTCGFFPLLCTLVMTELNTSTLLAFAGLGYLVGLKALFLPAVFFICFLFYAFTVATKYKEKNFSSCSMLFKDRFGSPIAKLASSFLFLAMMGLTATYVKSITLIFSPLFPAANLWMLSGALCLLILLMTLRGGLVAIIRTDIASFILVLLIFPLFLFSAKQRSIEPLPSLPHLLPNRFILSLIILTMFTYILAPWYSQKIFSAKKPKTAFAATASAAIIVFALYGIATLATAYLKASGISLASPELAIPTLINLFPFGLRGMAYATLFMITATTLAGVWSAMSSLIIADFLRPSKSYKQGLILANIPVFSLSFALLSLFYWKRATSLGALL
ncbi:MAG: hypothetical protein KDK63_03730, partial [Chlamydiia bacterium]|nr:hypothetical protein [Chlamydiia bacterium]